MYWSRPSSRNINSYLRLPSHRFPGVILAALAICTLGAMRPQVCAATAPRAETNLSGVNLNGPVLAMSTPILRAQFRKMYSAGVRRIRVPVNWQFIQPEQGGKLNLWWLDRLALLSASYKIDLLPFVVGAPGWAAAQPQTCVRCPPGQTISATQPADPASFAEFAASLVSRYGPQGTLWRENKSSRAAPIRSWQIWNEPDLPSYWQSDNWASEYGTLLRLTRSAIRKRDSKAIIVLAGLTNYSPASLAALLKDGDVAGKFDVAAMNLFTKKVEDQGLLVNWFRDGLAAAGLGRTPIWVTEWTWLSGATHPSWDFPPVTIGATLARRIAQTLSLYRRSSSNRGRVERAFWYSWATSYSGDEPFDYGGLMRLKGSGAPVATPSLAAWSNSL